MRMLNSLVVVALFMSSGANATLAAHPGQLHKVRLKESPATVTATVGDLLELDYMYPVVPGQMPSDLKVEVHGAGLSKVGVVHAPQLSPDGRPVVGAGVL